MALNPEDCTFNQDGLTVTLPGRKPIRQGPAGRSRTDRIQRRARCAHFNRGLSKPGHQADYYSVHHSAREVQAGGLSGGGVVRVVKKLADRAGLNAAKYAGHSLRAGHATSAAIAGAAQRSIMNQTGNRSIQRFGDTSGKGACSGKTARGS